MSVVPAANGGSPLWITRRSHLQVSKTEVLPVIYKSRKAASSSKETTGPVPRAFPAVEVLLSDSIDVVRDWLIKNMERMYRVGAMNVKPGSLETPDVLRTGSRRYTVWFEPTAATFALILPDESKSKASNSAPGGSEAENTEVQEYNGFVPTPQTLYVVGELESQQQEKK